MSATLLEFARANDAAAATSSKLKKQAILAEYLRLLQPDDLRLAVRYAAGRPFAETDERVLNVGGATVSNVVLDLLQLDARDYYALVLRSGEIGEALARVWPVRQDPGEALTLRALAEAFDDLARAGTAATKEAILGELYGRCADPREAAYLTKIIFGDMRTGVQAGILQAAIATAFDKPLGDIQRCQLLIGDLEEVALLARSDALHTAGFRLFHPIQFMLATPQETAEIAARTMAGRSFFAEDKLDGIRAQIHKSGNRMVIYTRTMDRVEVAFPDVVEAFASVPGDLLLDGEIVPWCEGCVLPFAHIQRRLGRKRLTASMLRENPAAFIAFDILYHDGRLLMDEPFSRRRAVLSELRAQAGLLCTEIEPVSTAEQIAARFEEARARRNEGIILKHAESPYTPGRRGQAWLKLKTHLPTVDCVVTAAEYGHGKRRSILSDYTFAVWDREPSEPGAQLVNVGKAYTGLTDQEIAQLTELFLSISRGQHGGVHLVEPRVVLEIACDQIQRSTRHASGYAMRFPRIKCIRWDKGPEDADRLSRVAEIYESARNFARAPASRAAAPEPTLFDSLAEISPPAE